MSDPVRLGDVLALQLQQLDSMCRCGHALSEHAVGRDCLVVDSEYRPFQTDADRSKACPCRMYREAKCTP